MQNRGESQPKAAIFVDAENQSDLRIPALMRQFAAFECVVRRAYADWRDRRLDRLAEQLDEQGFQMVYARSGPEVGAKKNTADGHMARDIRKVIASHTGIEVLIIVSGDLFFLPVVSWLRQRGTLVIVAADPDRASRQLCLAADRYLALGPWAPWIQELDRLERSSKYLTFRFVVQRLSIQSSLLGEMIDRQLVLQDEPRPQRVRKLRLNRHAPAVRLLLDTLSRLGSNLALAA